MEIKKWKMEKEPWGECRLNFFVKEDKKFYYGKLFIPSKKSSPVDDEHSTEECVYCAKGSCTLTLFNGDGKKEYIDLKEENAVKVPKNMKHQWQNNTDEEVELIFVLYA
jgi:oxalate decarboxylase/phosphoglucose isomerase-like protein (cupin superfamily)